MIKPEKKQTKPKTRARPKVEDQDITSIANLEGNNFFVTAKKYLKDKIMTKEEYLVMLTQLGRNLKADATVQEKKFWLQSCDALAEASGWKRDNKSVPDNVIICFGFIPGQENKEKLAQKAREELPKLTDTNVIDIAPIC